MYNVNFIGMQMLLWSDKSNKTIKRVSPYGFYKQGVL